MEHFSFYGLSQGDRFHKINKKKISSYIIDEIDQINTANNGMRVFIIATKSTEGEQD